VQIAAAAAEAKPKKKLSTRQLKLAEFKKKSEGNKNMGQRYV
jgi:hypothetical protein